MGRRLVRLVLIFAFVLFAGHAEGQLPYLDDDGSGNAGFSELPWASLKAYPSPCSSNFAIRGVVEGSDQFDCAHVVDWPTGTPSDGWCIKYDAGTGGTRWEACGTGGGSPLLILGPDYVFYNDGGTDKLIYYTGS